MTEEEKRAAEDKARKDAEEKAKADAAKADGEKLDKVLSGIDSLCQRMDRADARLDAVEKKADGSKKDGEESEEEKAKAKELAADKAKKDAEDAEAKNKADAEEEEKKKADAARALADASVAAEIRRLESLIPKQMSDSEHREMASAQERADHVFSAFGDSAPRPLQGEDLLGYRRRLATKLKAHSAVWKETDLTKIADSGAFDTIEKQIYADAARAAECPADLPEGAPLRPIVRTDSTGRRITTFAGRGSFVRDFKAAKKRLRWFETRPAA